MSALKWFENKTGHLNLQNVEVMIRPARGGHTAEFYNSETGEEYKKWTGEDLNNADPTQPWNLRTAGLGELKSMPSLNEWFITVPMMDELVKGRVEQLEYSPGSYPGGRGFKSHLCF